MKVPLIVDSYVDVTDNCQKLEIWTNGERKIIEPPFKPYLVSKTNAPFIEGYASVDEIEGMPLSTLKKTKLYKYSFDNTSAISAINRAVERDGGDSGAKKMLCDNHTEFRERIIIDIPQYFAKFANTNDLRIFCFDLETLLHNRMDYKHIISAAWGWGLEEGQIKSAQAPIYWRMAWSDEPITYNDVVIKTVDEFIAQLRLIKPEFLTADEEQLYNNDVEAWEREKSAEFFKDKVPYVLKEDELRVVDALLDAFVEANPDIIIGYNHEEFDFVRLFERCTELNAKYQRIARSIPGFSGFVKVVKKKHGHKETVKIKVSGRVIYDVLNSVRGDQSLHGIKRRGLKDVAEWMKLPVMREDTINTAIIPNNRLKQYNEHDIFSTLQLFNVYFRNSITLCEMFGIPVNMLLDSSASFLANVFHGIDLHMLGIVSDGMNRERHPEIYDRAKLAAEQGEEVDDEGGAAYEAAYVDIYQTGSFNKIDKVDFKGMYNAIEITANISPETTKIIGFEPYNENGFKYVRRGQFTIYYVPDKRIGKTVLIAVNTAFDGVLRRKLKEIRETRFAIKQQMKKCAPEDIPKLESQQYGLKVVANIPSGYNGQAVARWGDIAVSILTVGIGRELIKDTIRYIESKYGGNDKLANITNLKAVDRSLFKVCVEVDTDGIYICQKVDGDELNDYLADRVKVLLGVEASEMQLDFDNYGPGCFVKMKNYILYDKDDNLVIHGAGLKGSRQPKCFDIALAKLAKCLLLKEGNIKDVINDVLDISQYKIPQLALGVKLSKNPDAASADEGGYNEGTIWSDLIKQAQREKMVVVQGTEFDYVKTYDGYRIAHTVNSVREIDESYYKNMISKLIVNLGLQEELMMSNTEDSDPWLYGDVTVEQKVEMIKAVAEICREDSKNLTQMFNNIITNPQPIQTQAKKDTSEEWW